MKHRLQFSFFYCIFASDGSNDQNLLYLNLRLYLKFEVFGRPLYLVFVPNSHASGFVAHTPRLKNSRYANVGDPLHIEIRNQILVSK